MDAEARERLEELFHAALGRSGESERRAFLDGACGGDGELRERVEALLKAHQKTAEFLEEPAIDEHFEGPGSHVGPYKLLQQIGEGGMGVVYMAEQTAPVVRKVALKVIKLGMDTKQVIARFEAERQALAMMDHPGIARVLDAGATEAGRPFFVMELVRGIPIHRYCDHHKLAPSERLALFVEVCRAVQHAHQKGVIHRDLKPANVLVTSHDGRAVPKIIDFGVAKATNQRLTERTLFTEFQQVVGTPEYMSPEQAEMSALDVDTRSDIYSLGVLLYQLLTGTTPVDSEVLREAGLAEMTRMIREDEPPAPSTRISKLGADADSIGQSRGSDPARLSRYFRGDLDWIVMKALEKDRTRRYETAGAFAADVVRHLESMPVEAGPPGSLYRLRKFTARHRRSVLGGAVLLIVVVLGLAGTTAGFLEARAEADRSQRINASLQEVLDLSDWQRAADPAQIEAVLDSARSAFGATSSNYAAVLETVADRVHQAGDFDRAIELERGAIDVWRATHGPEHPTVALARGRLGALLRLVGDDDAAEVELRAALAVLVGAPDLPGLASYSARMELAELLAARGDFVAADDFYGESLASLRASAHPSPSRLITTLEQRLMVQLNLGSSAAAETLRALYDETRSFYEDRGPVVAVSAMSLGTYLAQSDRKDEAIPLLREALERFEACDHRDNYYYLAAHDTLFQILRARRDDASQREADRLLGRMLDLARPYWSTETLVENLKYYATRMNDAGDQAAGLAALDEALTVSIEAGQDTGEREHVRDNLTLMAFTVAIEAGREPSAYSAALAAAERALADEPEHPVMLTARAAALYRLDDFDAAAAALDRVTAPLEDVRGGLARVVAPADLGLRTLVYGRAGQPERAAEAMAQLRAAAENAAGDKRLAALLAEAEALLQEPSNAAAGG